MAGPQGRRGRVHPALALLCGEAPTGRILSQPLKPPQVEGVLSAPLWVMKTTGAQRSLPGVLTLGRGWGPSWGGFFVSGLGCRGSTWRCWVNPSEGPGTALR